MTHFHCRFTYPEIVSHRWMPHYNSCQIYPQTNSNTRTRMLTISRKSNSMVSLMMVWVAAMMMMMTTMQQQQLSLLLPMVSVVSSFQPTSFATTKQQRITTSSINTALNVFGSKKAKKMTEEELEKYWQGEWVCKDCGYVYNRVR